MSVVVGGGVVSFETTLLCSHANLSTYIVISLFNEPTLVEITIANHVLTFPSHGDVCYDWPIYLDALMY